METPEQETHVQQSSSVDSPATEGQQAATQGTHWIELLVDPRTLNGLMTCGGSLLVLGLVVWLWLIGLFENKLIVAGCLGIANLGLLALGLAGTYFSRYQTASTALTMLACLVMPLNLWFYDAQGLVTLDQGGHLWVAALVCCALYVLVARVSGDPIYVYAIVGGVAMMGLLILADQHVNRLWEIMAPSAFLAIFGAMCIHTERIFPPEPGRFSRDNFGCAFFNAGHLVMAIGLIVLLVGRVAGRLYEGYLVNFDWAVVPQVVVQTNLRLFAIALALGATYTYIYSHFAVRAQKRFLVSALLTIAWAAIMVLDLMSIPLTLELAMLLAAISTLAARLFPHSDVEPGEPAAKDDAHTASINPLRRTGGSWADVLNYVVLGLGTLVFARVHFLSGNLAGNLDTKVTFNALFVIAAIVGSLASWLANRSSTEASKHQYSSWPIQSCALLFAFAVDGLLIGYGVGSILTRLVLEMFVPLMIVMATMNSSSWQRRRDGCTASEIMSCLFLLVGLWTILSPRYFDELFSNHAGLAFYFAAATISLGLVSYASKRMLPSVLSAFCFCVSACQLFFALEITHNAFLIMTSLAGVGCLAFDRVVARKSEALEQLVSFGQWIGRVCLSYGSIATLMIALARLLAGETNWPLISLLAVQGLAASAAAWISRESSWRRYYWALVATQLLLGLLVANSLTTFSFWQRAEMLLTFVGLVSLVLGYLGWSRETEHEEDLVSFHLAAGSFFSAAPLTIGMLIHRFDSKMADLPWVLIHEVGVLSVGLLLLGAGVLCRIRWSTIVGSTTLLVYVTSLIGMIHLPEQLETTAITMMIGGGLFFGSALLLSVYRDRLLAIPQRMHDGDGVFRVLKWR